MADSDLVNALTTANRSSSVLQGIANPTVFNPLQVIGAANQAAQAEFTTRGLQAQQALGNILQQATDPNGNIDYQKAHTMAAQAGPIVQMGMANFAKDNASLRGSQISQTAAMQKLIGMHNLDLLRDSSDDNVNRTADDMARNGMPMEQVEKYRSTVLGMNPDQRKAFAYRANLNSLESLHQVIGQTTLENNNGEMLPVTRYQPGPGGGPGGMARGPGAIPLTLSPAERTKTVEMPDMREKLPDGSPNPDYKRMKPFTTEEHLEMLGYKVLPNGQVVRANQAPGATPGKGPLGTGRYPTLPPALTPGGGAATPAPTPAATPAPTAVTPPAPAGTNPNAPVVIPPPPAPVHPNTNGVPTAPVTMLQGGVQIASANPLQVPQTGTPGPPSPLVARDVSDIEAGMAQARATPRIPGTQTAAGPSPFDNRPVSRMSAADEDLAKASGPRFQSEIDAGTRAQGQHAILANMLADVKQFTPGRYANAIATLRARLAPVFNVNEKALAAHDSFEKLAAQLALEQAGSVGAGSDSRFSVTQAANPHGGLSPQSIDLILRQLQGNADYIQARQGLAQKWPSSANYNGFVESVRELDPRVFQYQRMTDDQRKDWFSAMDERGQRSFMQAHKWAEDRKLIPGG